MMDTIIKAKLKELTDRPIKVYFKGMAMYAQVGGAISGVEQYENMLTNGKLNGSGVWWLEQLVGKAEEYDIQKP